MRVLFVLVLFLVVPLTGAIADDKAVASALTTEFRRSPVRTGFYAFDAASGAPVVTYRPKELFTPASILKLLTSYVALKQLGPGYRFVTEVYAEKRAAGFNVFIKAGGDPSFTTEQLEILARRIRSLTGTRIEALTLDESRVTSIRERKGQRAYAAGSSAMLLNFNSLLFEICPTKAGRNARILTDPFEYEVPIKGWITTALGKKAKYSVDETHPGHYKARGQIGKDLPCGRHYRSVADPGEFFLTVLKERLNAMGVQVGKVATGITSTGAALVYEHTSKELSQILEDLNHYSTNVIAEQVVTALGAQADGRLSHRLGLDELNRVAREFGGQTMKVGDASGLSRESELSPAVLAEILRLAKSDVRINIEFEKSLSVLGRNGTLTKRAGDDKEIVFRGKTGSLSGVSSLAGYIYPPSGRAIGFVMIQNGPGDRGSMQARENKVLKILNRL
jgi:D-alanyl-D-alanine carboxypeptidase/D-alanyl-D-alanine-endopeptidase (penicillin-binding protein 4)